MKSKTIFAFFFCAALSLATTAQQPSASPNEVIVTVVHIDFRPDSVASVAALKEYVSRAAHDPNVLHVQLLQQISAPNHFTLLETLKNMNAYKAHVQAPYTIKFRAAVDPALGAPYDERLHREFTP